ncbi:MAG TPA: ABC transporter permease [Dongiaceae bacterium]|jgi:ABC-type spermidine/putrescine transport system permease subunit II|nr:ABC transporter permease [Dongiaceae bacterium]
MLKSRAERVVETAAFVLAAAIFVVLYAPVVVSAVFSVFETRAGRILWDTFTVRYYGTLWSNESVIDALSNTAVVALCAVLLAAVLAVGLALYAQWPGAVGRAPLTLIIYMPFLLPPIVTGLSLLVGSANAGLERGLLTVIVGHTIFVLAVAYRLVLTRLQALPPSMIEASFDCGASRWATLRYVLLPHLASAIATGALLALTLSFDETLISSFVAGDRMTLPLRLWAMMRVGFTPEINALVTLVLLVSIALALVAARLLKPAGEHEED